MKYILASTSPRRKELLKLILPEFYVVDSMAKEKEYIHLKAEEKVLQLSKDKCFAAIDIIKPTRHVIITCDTVVEQNGKIFGKPKNKEQAFNMISSLSGRWHNVHSGVSVYYKGKIFSFTQTTKVNFQKLSNNTIYEYVLTKEPYDKAGGYGIQGFMAGYVKGICGDYYNVMGLPVQKLNKLLINIGAI